MPAVTVSSMVKYRVASVVSLLVAELVVFRVSGVAFGTRVVLVAISPPFMPIAMPGSVDWSWAVRVYPLELTVPVVRFVVEFTDPPPLGIVTLMLFWPVPRVRVGSAKACEVNTKPATAKASKLNILKLWVLLSCLKYLDLLADKRHIRIAITIIATAIIAIVVIADCGVPVLARLEFELAVLVLAFSILTVMVWLMVSKVRLR